MLFKGRSVPFVMARLDRAIHAFSKAEQQKLPNSDTR
jgi:hypothetical protein